MGWWSCKIMGGDAPLDALSDLAEAISWDADGLMPAPHDFESGDCQVVRESAGAIRAWMFARRDDPIAMQVGAAVLMAAGADMPEDVRTLARAAADADGFPEPGDPERRAEMTALKDALHRYRNGQAIVFRDAGLFVAMARASRPPQSS